MKKAITIIAFGILALAVLFIGSQTQEIAKALTLTSAEWDSYIHPSAEEVELKISIDTTAGAGIEGVSKRDLTVGMGELLFHKRTGIRKVACADCHGSKTAGTGATLRAAGGGEFNTLFNEYYELTEGEPSLVEPDQKPFKNRSILNSYLLVKNNRILAKGLQADSTTTTLEEQVRVALEEAHFANDLVEECESDAYYNKIAHKITGEKFTKQFAKAAISAWEQTQTTSENLFNRANRQPEKYKIEATTGMQIIEERGCNNCHTGGVMELARSENPLLDTVLTPRLDLNLKDHKGYFHDASEKSLYFAISKCDEIESAKNGQEELSYLEVYKVRSFINKNLFDKRYSTK